MIVHVQPGACRTDEFRLRLLFETGTCIFSGPDDMRSFWTGPLAAAFGLEPQASEPTAGPAGGSPADSGPLIPDDERGVVSSLEDLLADSAQEQSPTRIESPPGRDNADSAHSEHRLTAARLVRELVKSVHGQDEALERVASVTV